MKDKFMDNSLTLKDQFIDKNPTPRTNRPSQESRLPIPSHKQTDLVLNDHTDKWEEVLARWQYDEPTWQIINDILNPNPKLSDYFALFFFLLMIGGSIGVIGFAVLSMTLEVCGFLPIIIGFSILVVGIAVVWMQSLGENKLEPKPIPHEVIISLNQLQISWETFILGCPKSYEPPVIIIPEQPIRLRVFTKKWYVHNSYGGGQWSYRNIDLPIPPGKETEAEQLARWFHEVYTKVETEERRALAPE